MNFKDVVLSAITLAVKSRKTKRGYDTRVYVADIVANLGVPRKEVNVVLKQLVDDDLIRLVRYVGAKDQIELMTEAETERARSEKRRKRELQELRVQLEHLLPSLPHDALDCPIHAEVEAAYGPEGHRWDDNHFVVLHVSVYVPDDKVFEVAQKIAEVAKG